MARITRHYVLYNNEPVPDLRYRQIVSRASDEGDSFQLRVFGGEVVTVEPFEAKNADAEMDVFPTSQEADKAADEERDRSLAAGWFLYSGGPL